MSDLISRSKAIEEIEKLKKKHFDHPVVMHNVENAICNLPSAEPEDWIERNKERILQAGMEGREIEFRIGGRLFAIREKAQ